MLGETPIDPKELGLITETESVLEQKAQILLAEIREKLQLSKEERAVLNKLDTEVSRLNDTVEHFARDITSEVTKTVKANPDDRFVYRPKWDLDFTEPSPEDEKIEVLQKTSEVTLGVEVRQVTARLKQTNETLSAAENDEDKKRRLTDLVLEALAKEPPYNIEEINEEEILSYVRAHTLKILDVAVLTKDTARIVDQIQSSRAARAREVLAQVEEFVSSLQSAEGLLDNYRKMVVQAVARHPHGKFIWEEIIAKNWQRLNVLYEENITASKERKPKVSKVIRAGLEGRMGDMSDERFARAERLIAEFRRKTRLPSLDEMCQVYGVEKRKNAEAVELSTFP